MPFMIKHDWLRNYADFDFTCKAVAGLGQRLSGPNRLAELIPWLQSDYRLLEADYHSLWPALSATLSSDGAVNYAYNHRGQDGNRNARALLGALHAGRAYPAESRRALCDGCGQCCLLKLHDDETQELAVLNVACRLLDIQSCQCSDYPNRFDSVPDCTPLTPALVKEFTWLPASCASIAEYPKGGS